MQNIVKIFFNNDIVEVQTWAPLKNNMMGLHYWSPIVCFHLRVVAPPKFKSNEVRLSESKANPWPNLTSFVITTYIVQLVQVKWLLNGHAHANSSLLLNPILRSHTPILSKCVEPENMPIVFFFFWLLSFWELAQILLDEPKGALSF